MTTLYLFAQIAGTAVAFRTDEIEAVVRLKDLSPVPGAPDHVAGLSALRSRVLTVIDAAALVTGRPRDTACLPETEAHAIICDVSGHSYGILVDLVDDVGTIETPPAPVCGRVEPAWQPHVRTTVEWEGQLRFLLPVAGLLEHCHAPQTA